MPIITPIPRTERRLMQKTIHKTKDKNPVFYEDEVDIHLNPKIGADWQLRGQQKRVVTPGQNEKYYLASALHSKTGKVIYVGGNSKGSCLFIRLLKHLKTTYRRAKHGPAVALSCGDCWDTEPHRVSGKLNS